MLSASVVVTAYNMRDYIEECLLSIAEQSRLADQIILCDDASTDNTVELAKRIFPSITILHSETNQGALLNTLRGLKIAHGDVVFFMDGDDVWSSNKIEQCMRRFESNPSLGILTHQHIRTDRRLKPLNLRDDTHRNISIVLKKEDKYERMLKLRLSGILRLGFWFGSAYSVRRDKVDIQKFFDIIRPMPDKHLGYLDLVFGPFVLAHHTELEAEFLDDVILFYRTHENQSCSTRSIENTTTALNRIRVTNQLTYAVISETVFAKLAEPVYKNIICETYFLESLYRGELPRALINFLKLIPFFVSRGKFFKEAARLFVVIFFGAKGFLSLKEHLSLRRRQKDK